MLWSTVATLTPTADAPQLYPVIVIFQQLGAIAGSTLATYTATFGFPALFFLQTANTVLAVALMFRVLRRHEQRAAGPHGPAGAGDLRVRPDEPSTGFLEGLRIILRSSSVLGIFVISTFAEVVSTVMDFQMKVIAKETYRSGAVFSEFMGQFGQAVNVVSLLFAFLGTRSLLECVGPRFGFGSWFRVAHVLMWVRPRSRLGLRVCLASFPLATLVLIAWVWALPSMWVLFGGQVAIKALGYALNGPAREMLYICTSKDIKYKVRPTAGWGLF